jgi:hypothetical protein
MQLTTLLALAFATIAAAIPTASEPSRHAPIDRREQIKVGMVYNATDAVDILYAGAGCLPIRDNGATKMRLQKGYRCKFY